MQKKKRVYELARQYGKTDKEVLDVLKSHNVDVTSRLSGVDDNGCAILEKAFAAKKRPAKRPPMRTVRFDHEGRPTDRKKQETGRKSYSSFEVPEEPKPAPAPKAEAPVKAAPKAENKEVKAPAREEAKQAPKTEKRENRPRDDRQNRQRDGRNDRQSRNDRNDHSGRDGRNRSENGRPSRNGERSENRNDRRDRNDRSRQDRKPAERNSRPAPVEEAPAAVQRREKPRRNPRRIGKEAAEKRKAVL